MGAKIIDEESKLITLSDSLRNSKNEEKGFAHVFNVRIASARLNQHAVKFDMHNFKELDRDLNKIVS